MIKGADASSSVSWLIADLMFGFPRCMRETETKDEAFNVNLQRLHDRGAVGGGYCFASPALGSDATDDAQLAWDFFSTADIRPTDLFWLDLEKSVLGQDDTNAWARRWFDEWVRIADRLPGIYMGSGYLTNRTGEGLREHGFTQLWYARPLYAPDWVPSGPWPTNFTPPLPRDRDGNLVAWADSAWGGPPNFWQFAFGQTYDGNVFNGTLAQLKELNMTVTQADAQLIVKTLLGTKLLRVTPSGTDIDITVQDIYRYTYDRATKSYLLDTAQAQALANLTTAIADVDDPEEIKAIVDQAITDSGLKGLLPGQ